MPPSRQRQRVLAGLLGGTLVLAAATLFEVLGTVFFTVTVAYLLVSVQARLTRRGVPARLAGAVVTVGAMVAAAVPLAAAGYVLYRRRAQLVAFVASLPREYVLEVGGYTTVVDLSTALSAVQSELSSAAVGAARELPVLSLKFSLFAFLLYALLLRGDDAAAAVCAPVPADYRDVLAAVHRRVRDTLFTIYVLQIATAAGTFALAVPVFVAFGYELAVTLAFFAAVLQFLPVVGPSLLVGTLALFELSAGATLRAAAVLAVGLVVIAGLPDLLIRPRLATRTSGLSGGLYFVGFVGGLLTLGPVGIVAGPLVVALVAEATRLLAADTRSREGAEDGAVTE
ncbi:MAG: AI-2E family transporter [Halobacteriaceae archaeon]